MELKSRLSRLLRVVVCGLLVLAVLVPAWAEAEITHGVVTAETVMFRPRIGTTDYIDRLTRGWSAEVLDTQEVSGVTWYKIKTNTPRFPNRTYEGFVHGNFFRLMTAQEQAAWLLNPVQPGAAAPVPTATQAPGTPGGTVPSGSTDAGQVTGYVRITKGGTNLRQTPGGKTIETLAKDVVLAYYGPVASQGGYNWVFVRDTASGRYGYVRSDCYEFTDADGKPDTDNTKTPDTTVTTNYGLVTTAGASLRQTPGGVSVTAFPQYEIVTVLAAPPAVQAGWYQVTGRGFTGYIAESSLRLLTPAEAAAYLAGYTPSPVPMPGAIGYVRITRGQTNLRDKPDGRSLLYLNTGDILPYFSAPVSHAGYDWIYVYESNSRTYGYVRNDCYVYEGGQPQPSATPYIPATQEPGVAAGYVRLVKGGVNLRKDPGGQVLAALANGTVLPYFGAPVSRLGYNWVQVRTADGTYGYVRSDCYVFSNESGQQITPPPLVTNVPVVTHTPAPVVTVTPMNATGYLKLIKGGVNLRKDPGGKTFAQLDRNTVLPYYGFAQQGGYTWYYVQAKPGYGYIRSDMVQLTDQDGDKPAVTDAPTDAPQPEPAAYGYLMTTLDGVNLRKTASSTAGILGRVKKQTVLALSGPIVSSGSYNWYPVISDGRAGFLRGDCVRLLSAAEVTAWQAGTIPPIKPAEKPDSSQGATGHVMTTETSVNLRSSPSLQGKQIVQLPFKGTVLPYVASVTSGGRLWYQVIYEGQTAYVMAAWARIMTDKEYQEYINTLPTPTPTPAPTATPRPEDMSMTAITVMDRVLVRASASSSAKTLTILYRKDSVAKLLGPTATADGHGWYEVNAGGVTGWIRADMLRVLTKEEAAKLESAGDPDAPSEASYPTLRLGSTGPEVTRLQTELARLNFLPQSGITGDYTSDTVAAVKAYQRSAGGLIIDGVAGPNTQHKLFNTVPEGTYTPGGSGSTVTPVLYPVEKTDWSTGEMERVWGRGEVAILTDVKTRISFQAKRWAGGAHIDAEPLTAADTAAMCKIYGVRTAQEILEKNLYERRPLWVTIHGRTFAASLYGVPHNYPDGDTIPDNEFSGQFCVHFLNSRIHRSNVIDKDHMKAVQYAYDHAPSKK
ncbi:MAG: SH3 domain-containing protein [Christensenellales bacterium]